MLPRLPIIERGLQAADKTRLWLEVGIRESADCDDDHR